MKNKVPCCVINVMLYTTTKLDMLFCAMQHMKTVHMEIVVFILYSNKKLLIYHFHQETYSIVNLVETIMYDTLLTSFAVYDQKA